MPTRRVADASGAWDETFSVEERETGLLDRNGDPIKETVETIVSRALVQESNEFTASRAAARTAGATAETKRVDSRTRVVQLAQRAARFSRNPVANAADELTPRLQHELLARLALAEAADE
jgi:hypothetical protein